MRCCSFSGSPASRQRAMLFSNRTNSCIVFCGIVVIGACKAGPHVFVTENRTCGVQLLTRPVKFWRILEQPWLEKAIAADIANSSEVREGTYATFPRQRAQFDYRRFDGSRGAGVEQALTPAWSIRFECECMSFGGTASGDLWESSCEPWVCQNLKTRVEWSRGRLHFKPHSCCLPCPVVP